MGIAIWEISLADDTPHFVDFDDCMGGPPIQDLWMLLSGERPNQTLQLNLILDAYRDFHDFDVSTLNLIEPLRTLRIMHHAADSPTLAGPSLPHSLSHLRFSRLLVKPCAGLTRATRHAGRASLVYMNKARPEFGAASPGSSPRP